MYQQNLKDHSYELALEKEKSVFVQAPVSNITILVMSSIAYLLIFDKVNTQLLILWFVAMFLMAGLRLIIWFKHLRNPARFSSERWILIYTVMTGLLGLVWSSLYLFGYDNADPLVSFVVYMTFFGVLSAAASVLSVHLPLFIVYTYPQAIVFSLILILNVSDSRIYLSIAVLVYMIMLTLFTRNTHKQFVNTIRLQSENSSLIVDLNKEVEQREQLIGKRTRELIKTNEELGKEIHERKSAQEEAGFQVSLLNSVLNSTPDLIFYKDYVNLDGCYIGCNEAFAKSCGLSVDSIIGQNDIELFGHEAGNYIRAKDRVALHSEKTHPYQEWITYPDDHRVLLSILRTPLYGYNQKLMGILSVGRDITEMKNVEDQLKKNQLSLQHQAHHDALTGLPNRLLMIDRLQQAIKRAKRANEGLAIMFIDLDRFKEVNDSLGHSVGDQLLKAVASRLKGQVRKEEAAAKLGGDEFTIILERLEDSEYASSVAQKLLQSFNKPVKLKDRDIKVSLSIGISLFPEHGVDTETLLRNADSAMYQAKKEGRNGYCLYTENLTQRVIEHVELETTLRNAIENDELGMFFQPQIDLLDGHVVGCEALLRWLHPQQGILLPERFIPLAEETGLISEIDLWVLNACCQSSLAWKQAGFPDVKIAVNLSGRQLRNDQFANEIKTIIAQTGCSPELIELEIRESYLINHTEKTTTILNELTDIGVQLTIDDFGTGHSSIACLKKFPINKIKIDSSLVRETLQDPNIQAITGAVITLGKSLGLKVLADGVEEQQQHDFVKTEGCDEAQGFYYAKPMTGQQFLTYLQDLQQ